MPLPKTRDVGKVMRVLKKERGRPHKQMVAIALDVARRSGAKIPQKGSSLARQARYRRRKRVA